MLPRMSRRYLHRGLAVRQVWAKLWCEVVEQLLLSSVLPQQLVFPCALLCMRVWACSGITSLIGRIVCERGLELTFISKSVVVDPTSRRAISRNSMQGVSGCTVIWRVVLTKVHKVRCRAMIGRCRHACRTLSPALCKLIVLRGCQVTHGIAISKLYPK